MTDKLVVSFESLGQIVGGENRVFGVTFIKRTTGESRRMRCFLRVKKHIKGGNPAYDFKEKGLVSCWIPEEDRRPGGKDNGYRSFGVSNLLEVRAQGNTYQVVDGYFVQV